MDKQFNEWAREQEMVIFKKKQFEAIGKGKDYVFQALAFAGSASADLSIATTILSNLNEVPEELKEELKSIQNNLTDFKEKLRHAK